MYALLEDTIFTIFDPVSTVAPGAVGIMVSVSLKETHRTAVHAFTLVKYTGEAIALLAGTIQPKIHLASNSQKLVHGIP